MPTAAPPPVDELPTGADGADVVGATTGTVAAVAGEAVGAASGSREVGGLFALSFEADVGDLVATVVAREAFAALLG